MSAHTIGRLWSGSGAVDYSINQKKPKKCKMLAPNETHSPLSGMQRNLTDLIDMGDSIALKMIHSTMDKTY